ncbi:serine hydrolase domain-containing protein [Steroidobacter sp.]|uniref:serine hydrolase domain-containing protein n=1 Tax=Steroidobacter sp. TaxID=1978227 RepID=UPI001A3E88B8|nr:serine hydrolase domain-containing protein [Steroidobacter sp.]MBL8267970.1 beta-lactamase family protein [Steroidobacter sp.]
MIELNKVRPAAAVLLLAMAVPALAADRFEEIRSYIKDQMVAESVPSISVAVAKDGKIIWEESFGWADREKRVAATPHTMYSLASISKPITTTGLMTLVQAGKVDLDKPINDYLGNVKLRARVGDAKDATVRRVANHTSGLPLYVQFFYADEPYSRPSMDETILRYGNLVNAPGEAFVYSNLGFGVLDYVISRVSGMSYPDFMRREVFLPLGMTRTSVDIGPGMEEFTATRYGVDGLPIPFYDFDHPGASAVYSSAHDLVRFGMFHMKAHLKDQKPILSDASIDEMHQRTAGVPSYGYGVGFFVNTKNNYDMVGHSGGMGGVHTQLQMYPSDKLVVVVLANSATRLPTQAADRIANKMLAKWPVTPESKRQPPEPFKVTDSLLGTWKGTLANYVKDVPVELTFLASGDVRAKFGDQMSTLVNEPSFKDGVFSGQVLGKIGTPDTERYPYTIGLTMRLRGDVLNGDADAFGLRDQRPRNALSHWIELKKQ